MDQHRTQKLLNQITNQVDEFKKKYEAETAWVLKAKKERDLEIERIKEQVRESKGPCVFTRSTRFLVTRDQEYYIVWFEDTNPLCKERRIINVFKNTDELALYVYRWKDLEHSFKEDEEAVKKYQQWKLSH